MRAAIGLFLVLMLSCTGADELHVIEINEFDSYEENVKLVEDLTYYDPLYLVEMIPVLRREHLEGIKILPSNGRTPRYRIVYTLENPAILSNRAALKRGFEEFIPQLARRHASHQKEISNLESMAAEWLKNLSGGNPELALMQTSERMTAAMGKEGFDRLAEGVSTGFGRFESLEFIRAQAYEAYLDYPESVAIKLAAQFELDKNVGVFINFEPSNRDSGWAVMGVRFQGSTE